MAYEWIPSPSFKAGRTEAIKYIVIHHWDDPAKKPKIEGVINRFKDPAIKIAAHYVVSGDRVVKMVEERNTAWHARSANPYTIGIEVDPQVPGNTYETTGALVSDIRSRHGDLPLRKHSYFVNTSCPGNLDLSRIEKEAANMDKATQIAEIRGNRLNSVAKALGVNIDQTEDAIYKAALNAVDGLKKARDIADVRGNLFRNLARAVGLPENAPAEQIVQAVANNDTGKDAVIDELINYLSKLK